MKQKTIFDEENRLEQLSQLGDPLEILNRAIKWEKFRSELNQGCRKEDTGKGGRPPYDVVMMVKILVLQRLYNLSDDQTEYQINGITRAWMNIGITNLVYNFCRYSYLKRASA